MDNYAQGRKGVYRLVWVTLPHAGRIAKSDVPKIQLLANGAGHWVDLPFKGKTTDALKSEAGEYDRGE